MARGKLTKLEKYWILYDVANSAFILLVTTIVPIYFNSLAEAAGISEVDYLAYWGYAASVATLVVALIGPVFGTMADMKNYKKPIFTISMMVGVLGCAVELLEKDPAHYRLPGWLLEETKKVSHRQYSTGFYFGQPDNGQYYESGGYIRNYDVAAVVEGWEEGMLLCTQRNRFFPGETLEVLLPGKSPELFPVPAIFDTDGQSLEAARHPMQQLRIPCARPIAKGTILRRQQK